MTHSLHQLNIKFPSLEYIWGFPVCVFIVSLKLQAWLRGDFNSDPRKAPPNCWLLRPPRPFASPGCPPGWKATETPCRETSLISLVKSEHSLVTLWGLTTQGFWSLRMSQALVTSPFNSGTKLFSPLGMKSCCLGGRQFWKQAPRLFTLSGPGCQQLPVAQEAPHSLGVGSCE